MLIHKNLARKHLHWSDLLAFVMTILVAVYEQWSAADLVWSLWLSSLLLGYIYILLTIIKGTASQNSSRTLRGSPIFTLIFFSVHFLFFHFIHGLFLTQFFPMSPVTQTYLRASLPNTPWNGLHMMDSLNFPAMVWNALVLYWPFALISAFSRFDHYHEALSIAKPDLFFPYRRVIRMHLMIILLSFLWTAGLSGYGLYLVLIFYFFPFKSLSAERVNYKRA